MTDKHFTEGVFNDSGYYSWQVNRITFVLEKYGENYFKGKKVLELACFEGGISQMLHNLGANLVSVEGLERNLNVCKQRYPHLTFIQKDLDLDQWDFDDHYDIIIHWGLLYHLRDPDSSMRHCLEHCDYLFLESLVIDYSTKYTSHVVEENKWGTDQSIHCMGSRFSAKYVENLFDNKPFVRYDDAKLNSSYQPQYDWTESDTGNIYRRFWVITCK